MAQEAGAQSEGAAPEAATALVAAPDAQAIPGNGHIDGVGGDAGMSTKIVLVDTTQVRILDGDLTRAKCRVADAAIQIRTLEAQIATESAAIQAKQDLLQATIRSLAAAQGIDLVKEKWSLDLNRSAFVRTTAGTGGAQ